MYLLPACFAFRIFSAFSFWKKCVRFLKILPISALLTLVRSKISLKVRWTLHWRQAMKIHPAMICSRFLPAKAFASRTVLNSCLAVSETFLGIPIASHSAPISLYAAKRAVFPLSCVALPCAFWSNWLRGFRMKEIPVSNWAPFKSGLAPSPTRDGSSLP